MWKRVDVQRLTAQGDVPALVRAMAHADPTVALQATLALGTLRDDRVLTALAGVLLDGPEQLRQAALRALGQLADPRGAAAIGDFLVAASGEQPQARAALGQIGGAACVATLARVAGAALDWQVRCEAVADLARLYPQDRDTIRPALLAALGDPSPWVRLWAAPTTAGLDAPRTVRALSEHLGSEATQSILLALAELGTHEALAAVAGAFSTATDDTQLRILSALEGQPGDDARHFAAGLLRHPRCDMRQRAARFLLSRRGGASLDAVLAALRPDEFDDDLLRRLAALHQPFALAALGALANSHDGARGDLAVAALSECGQPGLDVLWRLRHHGSTDSRRRRAGAAVEAEERRAAAESAVHQATWQAAREAKTASARALREQLAESAEAIQREGPAGQLEAARREYTYRQQTKNLYRPCPACNQGDTSFDTYRQRATCSSCGGQGHVTVSEVRPIQVAVAEQGRAACARGQHAYEPRPNNPYEEGDAYWNPSSERCKYCGRGR